MKKLPGDPDAITTFDVAGQCLNLAIHIDASALRVIEYVSGLGGYGGAVGGREVRIKQALLSHEGVICG